MSPKQNGQEQIRKSQEALMQGPQMLVAQQRRWDDRRDVVLLI
jgi:hypothetical protein